MMYQIPVGANARGDGDTRKHRIIFDLGTRPGTVSQSLPRKRGDRLLQWRVVDTKPIDYSRRTAPESIDNTKAFERCGTLRAGDPLTGSSCWLHRERAGTKE